MSYRKPASFKNATDFLSYLKNEKIDIPVASEIETGQDSALNTSASVYGRKIGNRFCVLPMEGWDCPGGHPSEYTRRRWKNFGISGAKLIWGAEAASVRKDGMSNPSQLRMAEDTLGEISDMRQMMVDAHKDKFGGNDDLYVGLQLTHSGRFSRPEDNKKLEPKILYRHPLLDKKFKIPDDYPVLSDSEIDEIIADFIKAAVLARKAGFDFVDIKHCHGYLGHEFLSAFERPGKYGGCFENRIRFLREIVAGIRGEAPGLEIGVRLSLFDYVPFKKGPEGAGIPEDFSGENYKYAFGGDGSGQGIDFTETVKFLEFLESDGIKLVCATVGSPYYNPHIQRPAMYPPSDGYEPPENPLKGVERQIKAVAELKSIVPSLKFTGSGYTYLQEWVGNVAQAVISKGMADFVGLGRMMLPYPDMPADILSGRPLERSRICRTFSDCTTAPRNGMVSGCYPLDHFYKMLDGYDKIRELKKSMKG